MFVTKNASKPLYQLQYQRSGKTYESSDELFANWKPDTLDKSLNDPDALVTVNLTKVRTHTVGEALKQAGGEWAVCAPVVMTFGFFAAAGLGFAFGGESLALKAAMAGAGLGLGLLTTDSISEYRRLRSEVGTAVPEFSGYAYREKSDVRDVKLVHGKDLSFSAQPDGSILPVAASGEFSSRYIGYLKHGLPAR